jgi:hypothetical protein
MYSKIPNIPPLLLLGAMAIRGSPVLPNDNSPFPTSVQSSFQSTIQSSAQSSQPSSHSTPPQASPNNAPARPSVSAFANSNRATAVNDFATKALGWNKEELAAHLRTQGLTHIANMFESEVVDSKDLALMETGDLTSPEPEGFGLSEEDPMFQALWSLKLQLRAALDRAEMDEKFQK